jgi:hypothetical protein
MTSLNYPIAVTKEMMKDYVSSDYCAFALVSKSGNVLVKSIGWPVFEKTFKKHFKKNHLPKLVKKIEKGDKIYETKVDNFIVKYGFIINWPNKQGSFATFAIPQTRELELEITRCETYPIYF